MSDCSGSGGERAILRGLKFSLIFFVAGASLYLLGWLALNNLWICVLGFFVAVFALGAGVETIAKASERSPAYWDSLLKRHLPHLFVVGLVFAPLGYLVMVYVHAAGFFLWMLGFLALVFAVVFYLFYKVEGYVKASHGKSR